MSSKEQTIQMFGYSLKYWDQLEKHHRAARVLGVTDLIEEVATLRAKVGFYESRINGLNDFMHMNLEVKS